jgi:dihydroorotate dehydrogenase (NAD+) catalytic subunit
VADLTVTLGRLTFPNPVWTASGTFGYGVEYDELTDLSRLGGIVVKGISLQPVKGNPPPRIVETSAGMLNSIGLQNIGLRSFLDDKLPVLRAKNANVIANCWGTTVDEYCRVAEALGNAEGVKALEVNISCPNIKKGGITFGTDPDVAGDLARAMRNATDAFLIFKLSPNVTDIAEMARALEDAGADALSAINTITGMAVDLEKRRPVLGGVTGGLSGPAIKPVALRMVWQTVRAVSIPVVALGGIMEAKDALEYILVGAACVQVGTATFANPATAIEIIDGIDAWLDAHNMTSLDDLRGKLEVAGPRP